MTHFRQKKIAVTGISQGAGTTFLSVSLAFLLSMSNCGEKDRKLSKDRLQPAAATLLELVPPQAGKPLIYYCAGLDRRFLPGRFTDFPALFAAGKNLPQSVNLHKGVNWAVWQRCMETEDTAAGSSQGEGRMADLLRFPLEQMAGEYVVSDSPPAESLQQYDLVIAVIDPMPSALYAGSGRYETIRDMESAGLPVLWVVNRDSPQVDHTAMKRYLKLKDYVSIPELDRSLLYQAEYTGRLAVELMKGEERACLEDFAGRVKKLAERKKRPGAVPERFGDELIQLHLRK